MKLKLIFCLAVLILIISCKPGQKIGFERDNNTFNNDYIDRTKDFEDRRPDIKMPGDYLCETDKDCYLDSCQGCKSDSGMALESCMKVLPKECYCDRGLCKTEFSNKDDGRNINNGETFFPNLESKKTVDTSKFRSEKKVITLNNLKITFDSVASSFPPLTLGADLFIKVKNNGAKLETLYMTPLKDLVKNVPKMSIHFFSFQNDTVTIKPGEEKVLHWFSSNDETGEFNQKISFWQKSDSSDKVTLDVKFYSGDGMSLTPSKDAILYGSVLDGKTNSVIPNAEVEVILFSGRESYRAKTDNNGKYALSVPSFEQINDVIGTNSAYRSMGHILTVTKDNYEYYFKEDVKLSSGEKKEFNLTLIPVEKKVNYTLKWENNVSDYYGFFYGLPDKNWQYIVASQAKHSPQIDKPTNFYLFDASNGKQLWKYPTQNECWGIDISKDGLTVAAGCHDSALYVVNTLDGSLRFKKDSGMMNREVELSHNGKYLLTGPYENEQVALFNAQNGELISKFSGPKEAMRNSKFTFDDKKFIVGHSFGWVSMYSINSERLWENYIGEFPLFLGVDTNENTYATGKGRTLFSFDNLGQLRWSYRVPDLTVTSGAVTPDGSRIVLGTVGGFVYNIDGKTGKVLFIKKLPCVSVGHNAVSVTKDGKYISVGCAPEYKLLVLNEFGTKVFEYDSVQNPDPILSLKWATIGQGSSEGSQKGIMGTSISEDGSRVLAAYGDNNIKLFNRI